MTISNFKEAKKHLGHKIEIVMYGDENISIECMKCNEVLIEFEKETELFIFRDKEISLTQIKKLEKELEVRIYDTGMYRKMIGNWSITAEFDEEITQEYAEDMRNPEESDNLTLGFRITATNYEEDGKTEETWNIIVDINDDLSIIKIDRD
jgi:hypothetical protein